MTDFFRFPHTPHIAWLATGAPRDDKVLSPDEAHELLAGEVVLEEKLDGANLGFSVSPDGVLRAGDTAYVGLGGRTNGVGIQQLATHLKEFGVRVQAVPVTRALHLKSAVTALPDGTVIGWGPVVDDKEAFPVYEDVPEEGGAHVIVVGEGHLVMAASAPTTAASFRARGYVVDEVDISELEKLEGCVTCLSVRVRG